MIEDTESYRYFVLHKPFNMVSQFVSTHVVNLLGNIKFNFPEGTHAIGRLDKDSEGLLLLTTDKRVTKLLFKSKVPHKRTYAVKVMYEVSEETLQKLRDGVEIFIRGAEFWTTSPCEVQIIKEPKNITFLPNEPKAYVPNTWLQITLTEGKYHQVRKMVKVVGHKCNRLIRTSIEDLELGDLPAGEVLELNEEDFYRLLKL